MGYAVKLHSGEPGQKATYGCAEINAMSENNISFTEVDPNKPFRGTSLFVADVWTRGTPAQTPTTDNAQWNINRFNNFKALGYLGENVARSLYSNSPSVYVDYGATYAYLKTNDNYNDYFLPNLIYNTTAYIYYRNYYYVLFIVTSFDTFGYEIQPQSTYTFTRNFKYVYVFSWSTVSYNGNTLSMKNRARYNTAYDCIINNVTSGDIIQNNSSNRTFLYCFDQL